MRSLLIVDDPARLAEALASGADALLIEATAPPPLGDAPAIYVRLPGLDAPEAAAALAAAAALRPRGVALAAEGGADVQRLGARLAVEEARLGLDDGALRILAFAAATPQAVFGLSSFRFASARLEGLAFGLAPLGAALGVAPGRRDAGPLRLARDLTLIAARAAGALALDAPFPDADDLDGLRAEALAAAADGFDGKAAISAAQIAVIHEAFRRRG